MDTIFPKSINNLKRILVKIQNSFVVFCVAFGFLQKRNSGKFLRLGSSYGGWYVDSDLLESHKEKILISAGLGHDVTFDIEMLKRGFNVIGLDPLESSFKYAQNVLSEFEPQVTLINAGIWKESGRVRFYAPIVNGHDSWSIINVQQTRVELGDDFSVIDLRTLTSDNRRFRNSEVRVLKLDIEGAEVEMFNPISTFTPQFNQVCIEMDFLSLISFRHFGRRLQAVKRARRSLQLLKTHGYSLENIENFNFTWVSRDSK
jgi:FkbM family methyltransferase